MLDPTCLYDDPNKNANLTIDIISQLVGNITPTQRNAVTPIIKDICNMKNSASFRKVITAMKSIQNEEARSLGIALDLIIGQKMSSLLIRPKRISGKENNLSKPIGLTIVSLMGLGLPAETKKPEDYNSAERVSISIIGLLTQYIFDILRDIPKDKQKILLIDEAWVLLSNNLGRTMISSLALLGRSLNIATLLITQSPRHLEARDGSNSLENTISSYFAFKNNSSQDNEKTVKFMGLPDSSFWAESIKYLEIGTCYMMDAHRRVGQIRIQAPEIWAELFNTNPNTTFKKKNNI